MENDNSDKFSVDKECEKLLNGVFTNLLVTNYIVIMEVASDQSTELMLSVSESMTPWLAHGMMELGIDMMRSGDYNFPILEDNNGQES